MKPIKIVIKTDGLLVRTKDLNIGLGILDHIAEHGIMKYTMISRRLLDRVSSTLDTVIKEKGDAFEEAIKKFKSYDVTEKTSEVPQKKFGMFKVRPEVNEEHYPALESKIPRIDASDKGHKWSPWSKEEIRILKENIDSSKKKLAQLIPTRTIDAITFKKQMLFKNMDGHDSSAGRKKKSKSFIWTDAELNALKLNINMKPKQLQTLLWLKRKSKAQISQKKYELTKRNQYSREEKGEQDEN